MMYMMCQHDVYDVSTLRVCIDAKKILNILRSSKNTLILSQFKQYENGVMKIMNGNSLKYSAEASFAGRSVFNSVFVHGDLRAAF